MDPERLSQAKEYQKQKKVLSLIHLFLHPFVLFLFFALPVSAFIRDQVWLITSSDWIGVALYFTFFSLIMLLFEGGFSYYSGYVLERKFNLSNQTFAGWALDFGKKTALGFVFMLLLIEGLYALIREFPETWWLLAWAAFAAVSYGLGRFFPVFIVPLFYKYGPVNNERVKEKVVALANRYAMPLENVYSLNLSKTTKKANAAFLGLGKSKRVVLSDTLLENFTPEEIEMVVAHELGHFKHRDIWRFMGLSLVSTFIMFWFLYVKLDVYSRAWEMGGQTDLAAIPMLFLLLELFQLIWTPLQNFISRAVEKQADFFALKACQGKEHFISCMNKLAEVNLADPDPHPLIEWYFHDHPTIKKRIAFAESFQG